MRTLFRLALAAFILFAILGIPSLWSFAWTSPDRSTRLQLNQGVFRLWIGETNDFVTSPIGFSRGGWSGDALEWSPRIAAAERLWVSTGSITGDSTDMRQIVGLNVTIPWIWPLALLLLTTFGTSPPLLRALRRRRNRCPHCGYDLKGLTGTCPECGNLPSSAD